MVRSRSQLIAGVKFNLNSTGFSMAPKFNPRAQTFRTGPKAWLGHHPRPAHPSIPTADTPHSFPVYLVATAVLSGCQPDLARGLPRLLLWPDSRRHTGKTPGWGFGAASQGLCARASDSTYVSLGSFISKMGLVKIRPPVSSQEQMR